MLYMLYMIYIYIYAYILYVGRPRRNNTHNVLSRLSFYVTYIELERNVISIENYI